MAYHQLDTSAQSQGIAAFRNFIGEWSLGKLLHPLNSATATVTRMFGCVAHICCYTSKATTPTPGCSEFLCDCGMTGMCRLHGNWHQMEFNRFTGHFHLISTLSSVFTVVSSLNIFKLIENYSSAREPMRFSLSPSDALIGLDLGKYLKGGKVVQSFETFWIFYKPCFLWTLIFMEISPIYWRLTQGRWRRFLLLCGSLAVVWQQTAEGPRSPAASEIEAVCAHQAPGNPSLGPSVG